MYKMLSYTPILVLFLLLQSTSYASSLSFNQLSSTPEFWPYIVTYTNKKPSLYEAMSIHQGDKLYVIKVQGRDLVLAPKSHARHNIVLPVSETDFVKRANKLYNNLTPQQREINYKNLKKYSKFFPYKTKLLREVEFSNGGKIKRNTQVVVIDIESNNNIVIQKENKLDQLILPSYYCDILSQVRANSEKKEFESRYITELKQSLQTLPKQLESNEYFLIHAGNYGCSRTEDNLPYLDDLYNRKKEKNAKVEFIFYSMDREKSNMNKLLNEGVKWPVIKHDPLKYAPLFSEKMRIGRGILAPILVLIDKNGNIIAYPKSNSDYRKVMQKVASVIDETATKQTSVLSPTKGSNGCTKEEFLALRNMGFSVAEAMQQCK